MYKPFTGVLVNLNIPKGFKVYETCARQWNCAKKTKLSDPKSFEDTNVLAAIKLISLSLTHKNYLEVESSPPVWEGSLAPDSGIYPFPKLAVSGF